MQGSGVLGPQIISCCAGANTVDDIFQLFIVHDYRVPEPQAKRVEFGRSKICRSKIWPSATCARPLPSLNPSPTSAMPKGPKSDKKTAKSSVAAPAKPIMPKKAAPAAKPVETPSKADKKVCSDHSILVCNVHCHFLTILSIFIGKGGTEPSSLVWLFSNLTFFPNSDLLPYRGSQRCPLPLQLLLPKLSTARSGFFLVISSIRGY
jgi:hypothetical protein